MTWVQILSLIACPLMMLLCMRGMFSGKKCAKHGNQKASSSEMQKLQDQVQELMEQNQNLMREIRSMKES